MALYKIDPDSLQPLEETTFTAEQIREREGLQALLRDRVEVIAPDTMVLAEEYSEWQDSYRRIDLLALDQDANLVVIELKRTEDGGHMELQALRYAAMVSTMTFEKAVKAHEAHLRLRTDDGAATDTALDAESAILGFLGWDERNDDAFAQDVRIVLASADFSRELTTAVLWLTQKHDLDIRCVRLKPYRLAADVFLDVQQIIPLPEAQDYLVRAREKVRTSVAGGGGPDFTRFDLEIAGRRCERLWKNRLVHVVFGAAIAEGIDPQKLGGLLPGNRKFIHVSGKLSGEAFDIAARAECARLGLKYNPRRYFQQDGELFHVDESTYALSNQWTRRTTFEAIDRIAAQFPELGIKYREFSED